jgi:DNA-binding NtrC family response regulator
MGQSTPIGNKTVLIVEDEALERHGISDVFADDGWQVHEARNAEEAMAVLNRHSAIRVVVTDVQIPDGMDGVKLAHYVRERFPPTLLFVVSGRVTVTAADLPDRAWFLQKPFDPYRILRLIERGAAR